MVKIGSDAVVVHSFPHVVLWFRHLPVIMVDRKPEGLSKVKSRRPGAGSGTAKFDLTLTGQETASGLRLSMRYTTDLFRSATITRMLGHFQKLLEGLVVNPDRPLFELPMLTDGERDLLLVSWNTTAIAVPRNQSVHRLFEEQAARTPQAVAAVAGNEQLSYRELDRRANQLARYLRARGVGPDIRVGFALIARWT